MRVNNFAFIILVSIFACTFFLNVETISALDDHKKIVIAAMVYGNHNVATFNGFKKGMEEKGYKEDTNIFYIFDGPYSEKSKLAAGMKKLISHKPDLIFSATTPVTRAAKTATKDNKIPVVFGPVSDPVHAGIVEEQKRPGGNITGVMLTDSIAKQLEWIIRINPKVKSILLPYNPNDKSSSLSFQKVTESAKLFNLELVTKKTFNLKDIDALLDNLPENIDAIYLPRDGMIMSRVEDFAKISQQKKLLLSGTRLEMAERGALFGFGFTGFEIGRQMARLADLILHGQDPADIPVETAEDYLAINLKTANTIGITIPNHILRQAHTLIRPE